MEIGVGSWQMGISTDFLRVRKFAVFSLSEFSAGVCKGILFADFRGALRSHSPVEGDREFRREQQGTVAFYS